LTRDLLVAQLMQNLFKKREGTYILGEMYG